MNEKSQRFSQNGRGKLCDTSLEINALPVREVGQGPSDQAMPRFEGGVRWAWSSRYDNFDWMDWHAPFFADI
jgi:hypothetical protein